MKAEKSVAEKLSIDGIRRDVAQCLSLEDENDPCYHCRQKLFLLEQLKLMDDVVAAMSPGPQVSSDPEGWGATEPVRES